MVRNLNIAKEKVITDYKPPASRPDDFQEAAEKSLHAGIADENAAYKNAIDTDTDTGSDNEVAEGKWKSTDDGSGTSETD